MSIDYRVDTRKLVFHPSADGRPVPPIQCWHQKAHEFSRWQRLKRRLIGTLRPIEEEQANRCTMHLGHWAYEGQREHVNGWGDRWPVTAAETKQFNPEMPP